MEGSFNQRLKNLGKEPTAQTICLQNTRLGKYLIFDLIGVGDHSTIYYGIEEATKQERIFKFYNLKEIETQKGFKQKEVIKRLSNYQYSLRDRCNSIHVMKQYDIYEDRNSKVIVSQFCNMGSLQAEINKRGKKLIDQLKAIAILKQIVSGIKNIHKNCNIVHKNLKTKNILISDGIYKIKDFGIPELEDDQKESKHILIPQILMNKDYDYKADVWSIGVLFHQILFGELPVTLAYKSINALISSAVQCIFDNQGLFFHQWVIQFLKSCLQTKPQKRMTWQQLQNHRMFQLIQPSKKVQEKQKISDTLLDDRMSVIIRISQSQLFSERQLSQSSEYQTEIPKQFYSKRFNLLREKQMLESELEQPYKKLGNYFQFEGLQPVSWGPLRKGINRSAHIQYQKLKQYYLQCLKVDFVYYDIITPLKKICKYEKERQQAQFIYLLSCRCFFQMSRLNIITKDTQFKSKQQNILSFFIKKQTANLYNDVKRNWKQYCELILQYENKYSSIFLDKLQSFFYKQEYGKKNIFFSGLQGIDFEKVDQIQYTYKFYQQKLRANLIQLADKYQKQQQLINQKPIEYLDLYIQIWKIKSLPQEHLNIKQNIDQLIKKPKEELK